MKNIYAISNNLSEIHKYLRGSFPDALISDPVQCALVDEAVSYGYLFKIREGGVIQVLAAMDEFLETVSSSEIREVLEGNELKELLDEAGENMVKLTKRGVGVWQPVMVGERKYPIRNFAPLTR